MRWLAALLLTATLARAEGEPPGAFDYYVLSLSWSPTFCALEGEARDNPQCDRSLGWVLHGLWPQYEDGWPSYCRGGTRNPSRAETAAMADIMGSSGSAWHQWKKHGRCSGLSPEDYFALARVAFDRVTRPDILRKLDKPVRVPAAVIEEAFLQANPDWTADMLTITCKAARIQEARVCLTRSLEPRACGSDVIRDCAMQDALFDPIR
ncbi:MAG: ribonuclease T2 [Rhodobacter sp.]|nr:ribonuclease T2 [Rhodobacter sp.]